MNKFFKKLVTITAIVGGLFAQQASAVEAYTNELTGSETLPAGTYGAIDIQDTTAQALAANFVVPSTEILNAGVDNLIASNHMQSHTVQFWFKTAALSNSNIYYFRSTTTDRSNGYDLQLTDTGKLRFYVYNGLGGAGTSHFTTVTSPIVSNTWTHIAAVITKHATATQLAVEIFINGVSYASGTNSATKTNMDFANAHASFCPSNLHPGVFKEITFESGHTLAGIYIDDEVIDETKIIEKAISSLDQPPIFFKNLSFELMNGTQITTLPANQISSGFDTTNYDSDFWTNAGGPNVETGITINATDEPDGIASAFTKDAVGNTGGLQISTRPLSASTRITLKWWAKAQWSGKSRVQLMIADQPNSAFSTLTSVGDVESSGEATWEQYSITYLTQASDAGKYPAIHFIGTTGGWGAIDQMEFTETNGPILHFNFDETAGTTLTDEVSGSIATADTAAWHPHGGKFHGAYDLTGNDINLPMDEFNTLTTAFTLSFWFKGATDNTNAVRLIRGLNDSGEPKPREVSVWLAHTDQIYYHAGSNGGNVGDECTYMTGGTHKDDVWHHWVFTKDTETGDMKIFLDKALVSTATGKTTVFGDCVSLVLGNKDIGGGMRGLIDNLKIFNYALSDEEVTALDPFTQPEAQDDIVNTKENSPVTIFVKNDNGNGFDIDPNDDLVAIVSQPASGTLLLTDAASGEFLYTPVQDAIETVTFEYSLGASQATVTINVGTYVTTQWNTDRMKIRKVSTDNRSQTQPNISYDSATDGSAYAWLENETARSVEVNPGVEFQLNVTTWDHGASNGANWGAQSLWIDWNNDGVFDDNAATEKYVGGSAPGLYVGNIHERIFFITPPANAVLGQTRMRIMTSLGGMNPHTGSGRAVDFSVNITELIPEEQTPLEQSANLDGAADGFITIPHDDNFNTGPLGYNAKNEAMAAMVWVKTTATSGTIFNRRVGDVSKSGYYAKLNASGQVVVQFSGWLTNTITTTAVVNDDQWHHIAIIGEGQLLKIYIDGIEDYNNNLDVDDGFDITAPIVLGAEQDGSNRFVGHLKDFRVYQSTLIGSNATINAADINQIMQDQSGNYSMANLSMLVRLRLNGDLINTGTLGNSQDGTTTGTITYPENFTYPVIIPKPVVSINFVDDISHKFFSDKTYVAGVVEAGYWNATVGSANLSDTTSSDGTLSGISLTWNATGSGGRNNTTATGYNTDTANMNDKMMQTSAWAHVGEDILTLSGIEGFVGVGESYDIIVYIGARSNVGDNFWTDGTTDFSLAIGELNGPFFEQFQNPSEVSRNKNYIVFRNLTGDSFLLKQTTWSSNYPNINGLQIVKNESTETPRPTNLQHPSPNTLTWDPVVDATGYKITISRNKDLSNPLTGYDEKAVTGTTFDASSLVDLGVRLYFGVKATTTANGDSINSTTWFIAYQVHTTPDALNGDVTYLSIPWVLDNRFRITEVLTTTGQNSFNINHTETDFTTPIVDNSSEKLQVFKGLSYDMDIKLRDNGNASGWIGGQVWIDWNRDGDWEDENEALGLIWPSTGAVNQGTQEKTHTVTITVPVGASNGDTRMRIRVADSGATNDELMDASGAVNSEGTAQDFTIQIKDSNVPVAIADNYSAKSSQLFSANVKDNDILSAGVDTLTISSPTNGTLALNANGIFTYTPNVGFTGVDSFVYELGSGGTQATVTIQVDGLLLYYKFDESEPNETNVLDEVIGNVTTNGTADLGGWSLGKFGNAMRLDGNNIELPVSQFNRLDTALTLSFWFKGDVANTENVRIIKGLNSEGNDGREINIWMTHGDKIYLQAGAEDTTGYDSIEKASGGVESDDQWHHWVFTKDSVKGEMKIYLDNALWHSATGKTKKFGVFTSLFIGNTSEGNGMKGLIDNLKVFNYALSADEVTALDPDNEAIDDQYTLLASEVLSGDVKVNDINADALDVTVISPVTKGTLVLNTDGTFTYTPSNTLNSVTDTFVYELGNGGTQATVTINVQGVVFHYKLNEEPGETVVVDSTGRCPDSDTLDSTIVLTGATGGTDLIPADSSLDKTAEITTTGKAITISNLGLALSKGITLVGWIKPKVGTTSDNYTGLMYTRDGTADGGLSLGEISATNNNAGDKVKLKYQWGGDYGVTNTNTEVTVGQWNFVAMSVDPVTKTLTVFTAGESSSTLAEDSRTHDDYAVVAGFNNIWLGKDSSNDRTFKGYMRDMRLYDYTLDNSAIEKLFKDEIAGIVPPYAGLQAEQVGDILSWTVTQDNGVAYYTIINIATGAELAQIPATGGPYEYTLPNGVRAKIKITDKRGFDTWFSPTNPMYSIMDYDLLAGWNLISISGDEADLTDLEAKATPPFYRWDGSNYEQITGPVTAGEAFWIFAPNEAQVSLETKITTSTISFEPGWNMTGLTDQPFSIPDSIYSIYIWGKNDAADTSNTVYERTDTVEKGVGYWFFSF